MTSKLSADNLLHVLENTFNIYSNTGRPTWTGLDERDTVAPIHATSVNPTTTTTCIATCIVHESKSQSACTICLISKQNSKTNLKRK